MGMLMRVWFFLLLGVNVFAQRDALISLYTSTNGATWTTNTNWLDGDPCGNNWFGVGCVNQTIVEVDLTNNNLTGTLPSTLAIPTLTILRVGDNTFLTGAIPDYSTLNFTEIYMNNTGLTGSFPTWFARVPTLVALSLDGSNLVGGFPVEWCYMTSLQKLSLGSQNITGGLPDCIGNMSSLISLEISNASFGGVIPSTIGNMANLKILTLVDTNVTGTVPASVSSLNLIELRLKGNLLEGTFPSLEAMQYMVYLSLASNYFTGTIPQWLGTMNGLLYLDIRCNNFTGPLPEWLKDQPTVTNVLFACNNISNLPQWCMSVSHCGDKGCEGTRCDAIGPANSPPNKAVIIVLACFLGMLLIGNVMLMVFLIRRKCMRYDHTAELKPILSPTRIRRDNRKEREEAYQSYNVQEQHDH